jgi:hypothetical protein
MDVPFCPNPRCHMHFHPLADEPFYQRHGFYLTKAIGPVQRYHCTFCGRTFSDRTFHIDYWTRRSLDYAEIQARTVSGECVSAVARNLGCAWASAQNRIGRLARNMLAMHQALDGEAPLQEDLVADGFESFDRSQYFPSHIGIVVGKNSQQLYAMSHVNHARKGSMTPAQKKKRDAYAEQWSCPRGALKESFAKALQIIPLKWDASILQRVSLITDEHPAYPGALRLVVGWAGSNRGEIRHERYSSRVRRDTLNPLFPVNYLDREIRKDLAAYARESTCFVRNAANGMERLSVYLGWHNYWKPKRVRTQVDRERCCHAEASGIEASAIAREKERVFFQRAFLIKSELHPWAEDIWLKKHKTPLKLQDDYLQKHAGGRGRTHILR